MEKDLVPWIAGIVEQSLQLCIHCDLNDPSTISTLHKFGFREHLSNIYLPTPASRIIQVVEWSCWPSGDVFAQLSDSVSLIEAEISRPTLNSLTQTSTPDREIILEGAFLQLERSQFRVATCFTPPRISLQIDDLSRLDATCRDIQGKPVSIGQQISAKTLSKFHGLVGKVWHADSTMDQLDVLDSGGDQENLTQTNAGQENITSDRRSKGDLSDLLGAFQNGPKRQPLAVQQNRAINAAAMAALRERHLPGPGPIQPVKETEVVNPSSPRRQVIRHSSPFPEAREVASFTQIAPRSSHSPRSPRIPTDDQQVQTAEDSEPKSEVSLSLPDPKTIHQSPQSTPRVGIETTSHTQSKTLARPDDAAPSHITSSLSKWANLRTSLSSTRFLSRASMRIPLSQENLLGKDTSYWPPLTSNPLPIKNLPVGLLSSITRAIDFPDKQELPEDEKDNHRDSQELDALPTLPAHEARSQFQETDSPQSKSSDRPVSDWSSSPPRPLKLPPDSSVPSVKEFSPDIVTPENEPKGDERTAYNIQDIAELFPEVFTQDPSLENQDLGASVNVRKMQGLLAPSQLKDSHRANEPERDVFREMTAPVQSSVISVPSTQRRNSDTIHTQRSLPIVQVLRTPAATNSSSMNRQSLQPSGFIGIQGDDDEVHGKAKVYDETIPVGANLASSLNTTSLTSYKISKDFEYNSSEDELPRPSQVEVKISDQSHRSSQPRSQASTMSSASIGPRSMAASTTDQAQSTSQGSNQQSGSIPRIHSKADSGNVPSPKFVDVRNESLHNSHIRVTPPRGSSEGRSLMRPGTNASQVSSPISRLPHNENESPSKQKATSNQYQFNHRSRTVDSKQSSSIFSPSSREDSVVKKRKRSLFEDAEDRRYPQSPTRLEIYALDPGGPAYRAARVKTEFIRQQARKRRLAETVKSDIHAQSNAPRHSEASHVPMQETGRILNDIAVTENSLSKPRPSQGQRARTRSDFPGLQNDSSGGSSPLALSGRKQDFLSIGQHDLKIVNRGFDRSQAVHQDPFLDNSFSIGWKRNFPSGPSGRLSHVLAPNSHSSSRRSSYDVRSRPSETDLRDVYKRFRSEYPNYTADIALFHKACRSLKTLRTEGKAIHPSLFDDFVIRRELEYTQYLRDVAIEGDDPVPYHQFFDETEPKYTRRILSVADLESLPESSWGLEEHRGPLDNVRSRTSLPPFSRASTPRASISERASGEASPEIPFSNKKLLNLDDDDDDIDLSPTNEAETEQGKKWYHDPNTAFKNWARGISKRDKPLVDENGVPWRSVASEKVVNIFKRY